SDDERRQFENLLILCGSHHDVVDDDEDAYTVERLLKMKADHEAKQTPGPEPSDDVVRQFLNPIIGDIKASGDVVISQNQMGGQTAHTIANIGPQPRGITKAAGMVLVDALKQFPSESFEV